MNMVGSCLELTARILACIYTLKGIQLLKGLASLASDLPGADTNGPLSSYPHRAAGGICQQEAAK